MNDDKIKILVWPDGFWCYSNELEENLISGKSDDYSIHNIPIELNEIEIESYVYGSLTSVLTRTDYFSLIKLN